MLTPRENYLRNASFQFPEYIPVQIHINGATWNLWRDEMEAVVARHPRIWPDYRPGRHDWDAFDFGAANRAGAPFTDNWGCTWETPLDGIAGVIRDWPLKTWDDLERWRPPDPMHYADHATVDWNAIGASIAARAAAEHPTEGGPPHGFFFMRLTYLRGFENMMIDMATGEPRLDELINILYEHNRVIIGQYLERGVDVLSLGEDLGAQTAPLISPSMFRAYCRPTYQKLIEPAVRAGRHVCLHSDGYIMDLLDELLMTGVTILNPQDLCNGIDNLRRELKGRVCIRLDIDRQRIVPYGTRAEIRELIEEEVRVLGAPEGGLEFIAGIYPPTSPDNVDALAAALEEFQFYWAGSSSKP